MNDYHALIKISRKLHCENVTLLNFELNEKKNNKIKTTLPSFPTVVATFPELINLDSIFLTKITNELQCNQSQTFRYIYRYKIKCVPRVDDT